MATLHIARVHVVDDATAAESDLTFVSTDNVVYYLYDLGDPEEDPASAYDFAESAPDIGRPAYGQEYLARRSEETPTVFETASTE